MNQVDGDRPFAHGRGHALICGVDDALVEESLRAREAVANCLILIEGCVTKFEGGLILVCTTIHEQP